MRKSKEQHVKKISWKMLANMLATLGWTQTKDTVNAKFFDRNRERIALFKIGNKWKVDFFVSGRLVDSAGFNEEEFAKLIAGQMAMVG